MIKDILTGISVKLNQTFGDGYEIYGSTNVEQGLQEPCFFIAVLNPSQTKRLGQRYFREHPFDIAYFPKKPGDNMELLTVASDMLDALEYITLSNGDLLQGNGLNYEIVDGVLHFRANYNIFVAKYEDKEKLEMMIIDEHTVLER